jgi:hypothetical protein
VRDFEKRIDVVQVDLPKPEDLYLGRMRSRKVVDVNPTLEALMFSIYSVSILSLTEDQCSALFGYAKKTLRRGLTLSK